MKKNTVTKDMINKIWGEGKAEVHKIGEKTTMVVFTTKEGFVITESSSCLDPENYDERKGRDICTERIINKLWELEGYRLQKELANSNRIGEIVVEVNIDGLDEADKKMKELAGICEKVDALQQRIIKGQEKIGREAIVCNQTCTINNNTPIDWINVSERIKRKMETEFGVPRGMMK